MCVIAHGCVENSESLCRIAQREKEIASSTKSVYVVAMVCACVTRKCEGTVEWKGRHGVSNVCTRGRLRMRAQVPERRSE